MLYTLKIACSTFECFIMNYIADTTTEPTEPQVEEPVQEDAQPEEPKGRRAPD